MWDFGIYQLKGDECPILEMNSDSVWCWTCGNDPHGSIMGKTHPADLEVAYWENQERSTRAYENEYDAHYSPDVAADWPHP